MSCIAGIVNLDGAPVERGLLERMTHAMKSRAPDECGIWCTGNVGLGHAMLRLSPESDREHQPCSLDGRSWITADARIDGRGDLIRRLSSSGEEVQEDAPDPELLLRAYRVFGESFLEHVVGDFAFVIWDDRIQQLVCGRDHFGVRPFYFARTGRVFAFASDIDAIRQHPAVSRELDEEFIADFLLFGCCMEPDLTVYRDIRRLPAASQAIVSREEIRTRRYWTPPMHVAVRHKRKSDYVDQFQALLDQAVRDRMRPGGIALELSGGMDSTSVAAAAAAQRACTGAKLTAFTVSCRGLLPEDREADLAALVATHLDMPLVCQELHDYGLLDRSGTPELKTAEPSANPDLAVLHDKWSLVRNSGARILLSGQGGDLVFAPSTDHIARLLRHGRIIELLSDMIDHLANTGTLAGFGLRAALLRPFRNRESPPAFPCWINADFSHRVALRDRWNHGCDELTGEFDSRAQLQKPWLGGLFEGYEALRLPVVARHPFFDVRLATFLLGLPGHLRNSKQLLRAAGRDRLPESIRSRPKTGVPGDQVRTRLIRDRWQARAGTVLTGAGSPYIDRERFLSAFGCYMNGADSDSAWSSLLMITPIELDQWLGDTGPG